MAQYDLSVIFFSFLSAEYAHVNGIAIKKGTSAACPRDDLRGKGEQSMTFCPSLNPNAVDFKDKYVSRCFFRSAGSAFPHLQKLIFALLSDSLRDV